MKIMFETLEDKEEFIEENAVYDEEEDIEYYFCPKCHRKFEDFDDALDCCPCAEDEIFVDSFEDEEEE